MTKNIQEEYINESFVTDMDRFRAMLNTALVLDVGFIGPISKDGFTTVTTNRFIGTQRVVYENVEILYIGAGTGAFNYKTVSGSLCLVFSIQTQMPSTRTQDIQVNNGVFSVDSLKAIPLSNGSHTVVNLGYNVDGTFNISSPVLEATIFQDSAWMRFENHWFVQTDAEGNVASFLGENTLQRLSKIDGSHLETVYDANGHLISCFYRKHDGTWLMQRIPLDEPTPEEYDDLTTFTKWMWTERYDIDGTHTVIQGSLDGDEVKEEVSHRTEADGVLNIMTRHPVNFLQQDADDNPLVTLGIDDAGVITLDMVEAANLTIKKDITIEATDGANLSITVDGNTDLTVKGDTNLSSDGAINIESTQTQLVTIKNSVDTLGKLLTAFQDIVNTFSQNVQSLDTVGSPAAHSAGPGIIANMISLQANIAQLKTKTGQVLG